MNLDALTLSALVDEFMDTLVGGRLQDVIDTDATGLGLEIYAHRRRQYLYLSADKQTPRVHLMPEKLRRGVQKPTQLGLLLRRYVEGGTLEHVSQPPWERILHFDVSGPEGEVTLIVEPMARRSNVILLRDGVVLDCIWRVGPQDNRQRVTLPNQPYQPPPPLSGRADPFQVSADEIAAFYEQNQDPKNRAHRVLSSRLYGISPLVGKEIVFRAHGNAELKAPDADPKAIHAALTSLFEPLARREWQPGIAQDQELGVTVAFSVYPLQHVPGWQPVESVSAALNAFYGGVAGEDAYDEARKPVFKALEDARKRLSGKLASLESGLKDDSERETLRQSGELILAYQYQLQDGQTELRAQYDPAQPEQVIKLDPDKTPLENAQRYFDKYNRAKRAADAVPERIDETRTELAYLDQLENDLRLAANWPEIDEVIQALQARGYLQKAVKRLGGGGHTGPMKLVKDGYVIWVGRNSRQNELVTFKNGNPQDLWLHARDVPGAHVVIRDDGRRIPDELIEQAAAVAAYYSQLRAEGRVIVDVTRVKYVRKIKGAGPGMVTYRNEHTVTVAPQSEAILEASS